MTLISDGSMMLLKYKLNNVCDPKGMRCTNSWIVLIYHNIL